MNIESLGREEGAPPAVPQRSCFVACRESLTSVKGFFESDNSAPVYGRALGKKTDEERESLQEREMSNQSPVPTCCELIQEVYSACLGRDEE